MLFPEQGEKKRRGRKTANLESAPTMKPQSQLASLYRCVRFRGEEKKKRVQEGPPALGFLPKKRPTKATKEESQCLDSNPRFFLGKRGEKKKREGRRLWVLCGLNPGKMPRQRSQSM